MFHSGGDIDRAGHFALSVATLKRKGDDIQQQIDALQLAENSLMQAALDEAKESSSKRGVGPRRDAGARGRVLAAAVQRQVREAAEAEASGEPPHAATELARSAQLEAARALEAQSEAQAEAQLEAVAQAQQALAAQAEAMAQAQAVAEAQAQAISEAHAQAEAVAEVQRELQVAFANKKAEAQQAREQRQEAEAQAAERQALRSQGLNSRRLPLRPGVPPCSYFLRRGECKYGKTCKWDHPEAQVNPKGYTIRPGVMPCPFYMKTGLCNFGVSCKFDHPDLPAKAPGGGASGTQATGFG